MVKRSYYSNDIQSFLNQDNYSIFAEITTNDQFSAEDLQKNTWNREIEILKRELSQFLDGHIIFEYTIPRIGNRIDNIVIYKGIIFLLEFKVGEKKYPSYAIEQVTDYAFDLSCFHKESHNRLLVPILISTKAHSVKQEIRISKDNVLETICCNEYEIAKYITEVSLKFIQDGIIPNDWINSLYMPTPTIIEAAQALYLGHNVEDISRNDAKRNHISRKEAFRKVKEFIQIIHHFRDDAISVDTPPVEKVAIFDEAQRAWDEQNLTDFMKKKKHIEDFNMSEPEFLISILNRHNDWATIVCLIGGGQEINKGESAGIYGWFDSLRNNYPNWDIYVSDKITDDEYSKGHNFAEMTKNMNVNIIEDLHLAVSLRSFRSENVSNFVKALLDVDIDTAKRLYEQFNNDYPVFVTRNLDKAKLWVRSQAKGSQRYGLTASSGAKRLRKYGIWVQNKIEATNWFLNGKNDVRSSFHLEETATEFDIQGLELDWTIVCWDADLRFENGDFKHLKFVGTKWQNIKSADNILYLKNAYRVLLTRARQGFVIFVPTGDETDMTAKPEYYDGIYRYLKSVGIKELE